MPEPTVIVLLLSPLALLAGYFFGGILVKIRKR